MPKFPGTAITIGCLLAALAPVTGQAADERLDESTSERCVPLAQISRTDVVDDYNVLFYMRNGKIYRNPLPHRCIGLKNESTFMYRTSLSRLCDLDIITVLYNYGFGYTPGPSCGLGRFYPITEEEAKALKASPPRRPEPEELEGARPEFPGQP